MNKELKLSIKNNLSDLEIVTRALTDFVNTHKIPHNAVNSVDLSLDEVLNNIIKYGYRDKRDHYIDIEIRLENKCLIIEIQDDGIKFNPLHTVTPDTESNMDERSIGGLGIHLIRNIMDEVEYSYKNKKNCLLMKKKY